MLIVLVLFGFSFGAIKLGKYDNIIILKTNIIQLFQILLVSYKWCLSNSKTISNYKTTLLNVQLYFGMFICFCILFAYLKHDPNLSLNNNRLVENNINSSKMIVEHQVAKRVRRDAIEKISDLYLTTRPLNNNNSTTLSNQTSTTTSTTTSESTTTKYHAKKPEVVNGNQLQQDHKTKPANLPLSTSSIPSTSKTTVITSQLLPANILDSCLEKVNQKCKLDITDCQYKQLHLNQTHFNKLNISKVINSNSMVKCNNLNYTFNQHIYKLNLNRTRLENESLLNLFKQNYDTNDCFNLMKNEYNHVKNLDKSFVLIDDKIITNISNVEQHTQSKITNCFNFNYFDNILVSTNKINNFKLSIDFNETCFVFTDSYLFNTTKNVLNNDTDDYLININQCNLMSHCETLKSDIDQCYKIYNDSMEELKRQASSTTTTTATIPTTTTSTTTTRYNTFNKLIYIYNK